MSRQFLLSTTRPDHPNHKDITEILKRLMKNTLASRFKEDILVLAPDEVTNDNINYKEGLRTLHTNGVKDDITKIGNNKILNEPAPSIAKTEQTLPRSTRTTLAQLRSGYSTHLHSYLARIKPAEHTDHCPLWPSWSHHTTPIPVPFLTNRA